MPGPARIAVEPPRRDLIVVFGGSPDTHGLLRLATIRSDDILLVAPTIDRATRRTVDHFAVDFKATSASEQDIPGAAAVLLAMGDVEVENRLVRKARRLGIPVHVAGRPLVSDFTMLELVERRAVTFAPALLSATASTAA